MTELTVTETNCETGETTTRPFTAEEIAIYEANSAAHLQAEAERQAQAEALVTLKTSAKAKLVAGQPLTEEEAAVLVI